MKILFDPVLVEETKGRVLRLRPESSAQWGGMAVTPMMAHCTAGLAMAMGELPVREVRFPTSVLGRVIKVLVLRDDRPMRRNSPSAAELFSTEPERLGFEAERGRLVEAVDRFAGWAPGHGVRVRHPFFGPLDARQWGVLMYKHLDHHLRQFGA